VTLVQAWAVLCEGGDGDRAAAGRTLLAELKRQAPSAAAQAGADPHDALVQDALQRVALALITRHHVLREQGEHRDAAIRGYLGRALRNRCIDELRKRNKHWDGRVADLGPAGEDHPRSQVERINDETTTERRLEQRAVEQAADLLEQALLPAYVRAREAARRGTGIRARDTLAQLDALGSSGRTTEDLAGAELAAELGRAPGPDELRRRANALYKRFERTRCSLLLFIRGLPASTGLDPAAASLLAQVAEARYRLNRRASP